MGPPTFRVGVILFLATFNIAFSVAGNNKFGYVKSDDALTTGVTQYKIFAFNAITPNAKRIVIPSDNIARAKYENKINQTGWGFLELETNENYSDEEQAFAAGLLEGYLTYDLIYMHWFNTAKDFCADKVKVCAKIEDYVKQNQQWVDQMIENTSSSDAYWYQVKLFYKQLSGMAEGYRRGNKDSNRALSLSDLLWLNLDGDLEDLAAAFDDSGSETDRLARGGRVLGSGSCSALIKLLPDSSDLLVSHVTWSGYNTMLRLEKKYVIPFHTSPARKEVIPGRAMSFSSFPGGIQSGDDFFLISSGLVTLETTIGNGNASRWQFVKPVGQVLEVVRTMVANRLGHCGKTWSKIFTAYNSGTYNNQWMVVDYKRFKPGTPQASLKKNLLWVLEQLPGLIVADDVTAVLRQQSYWPSYNTPYFPAVFQMSGQQAYVDRYGDWFSYERTPRARIFRRDHETVKDLTSMMALMRYNDYQHDPLSRCNCTPPYSAENAVSARCDLNPANGTYPFGALGHRSHGATDAKITTSAMAMDLKMIAVSGPVYNSYMPPFQWSKSDYRQTVPHMGHPDFWQFPPVIHSWIWKQ